MSKNTQKRIEDLNNIMMLAGQLKILVDGFEKTHHDVFFDVKEILFDGRCTICGGTKELENRCWNCYESGGHY